MLPDADVVLLWAPLVVQLSSSLMVEVIGSDSDSRIGTRGEI